jgi:sporulation protein YlmC with PRC-barrel domain
MAGARNIITSDDILGKEAVDTEGEILGVVMKLHIDKDSKKMTGITIDQGFMKPDLFIGIHYIKNFGIDSVFLNRVPVDKFRGLDVITAKGNLIGKVKEVNAERHRVKEIIVAKKGVSRERFSVPASAIEIIGSSVVLKEKYRMKNPEK